ncbi:MAG: hypothetical protein K2Z25_21270 [Beijerinckiaceae bacterium]|nr:hypothetical protein [Bradyrhizobium sp. CCH5-A9]MBX9911222.1 hypothetical protein [Beijerinckiaceae bacterium]
MTRPDFIHAKISVGEVEAMRAELASLRESLAKAEGERDEARSLAGLGCDAANGGAHTIMTHPGGYTFCGGCGYTIKNPTLTERARKAEARALLAESKLPEAKGALGTALSEMLEARDRLLASGARTSGLDSGIEEAHKALANLETKEPSDV